MKKRAGEMRGVRWGRAFRFDGRGPHDVGGVLEGKKREFGVVEGGTLV